MADGLFYVDARAPHISADVASVTLLTTDLALIPVANIPLLGQNYFSYVGKALRVTMFGRITTVATPGNGTLDIYWGNGGAANGTIIASSPTFALTPNQTNLSWHLQFITRCRALGTSGSLMTTGFMIFNEAVVAAKQMIPASAPAATTVDLTVVSNVISPQFKRSGSTAETMQVHEVLYEALN